MEYLGNDVVVGWQLRDDIQFLFAVLGSDLDYIRSDTFWNCEQSRAVHRIKSAT